MSNHYKSNLRDLFFNLFEVFDIGTTTLGKGPFQTMDESAVRDVLGAYERLCVERIAPTFAPADREPLTLDDEGNVTVPQAVHEALGLYYRDGWDKLDLPERLGGFGAPPSVIWSAFELIVGANASVAYYIFGTFIGRIIDQLGTDSQRARYVENMLEQHWGGAMVLTEPDAGSDVGAGRSRARHIEGDVWELEGTKRFITNGDYDYPDNVVHLVLARPEGGQAGTKGLSMFIVPKVWVEEDGSLGERNGLKVTRLEKKMGLKASSTCELTLGADRPCRGLLVGEKHDGIRQMFMVIEHARMAVGVKSLSTLSTAYLNALAYTKDRVQGADLARATDKTAPRVEIIRHPDVRRMLMLLKCHAEGLRGLSLYAAWLQDQIEILGGHGSPEAKRLDQLNDLLLPLVKGYGSERVYELLGVALQCFGGSGYCMDYPMEQYIRDQKIDSLYEGTTHIQALDLFFRKIARDGGATLRALLGQISETITEELTDPCFESERAAMTRALTDVQGIFMAMMQKVPESVYHAGLQGNRILFALAELVVGWRLAKHASIAEAKRDGTDGPQQDFYTGKVASFRFYCQEVLPGLTLARKLVEKSTLDLMELPDDAF